ncbi:MAG TPA: glutamyl-tRNA reductase [Blastocatellia bacterium]|nr:glutamyl-tRNA reductase [Blastocatellia bacterium]
MNIVLIGISHKTAPLEMRERVAFSDDRMTDALSTLVDQENIDEGLILSTCNRVELLASSPDGSERGIDLLTEFLCGFHGLPRQSLKGHLYGLAGDRAVHHVFRVASSLDSMVVGESQILGQFKDAYQHALRAGTVGRVLSQVAHKAISVAKRVRTETAVSQKPVSISSVAVELACKVFGDLSDNSVMLVGAGDMGELTAKNLMEAGAGKLIVTNRTAGRAEQIAKQYGGGAINFEAFYDVLPSADIVICSTGAPEYVIKTAEAKKSLKTRRRGPLLFIDISVPRNIDPTIANLDDVFLFDVDDFQAIVDMNLRERESEARSAEAIVEAEVHQFIRHLRSLDIGPDIVEVKQLLSTMAMSEFNRNRKRIGVLTPEQEAAIQNVLIPALVNKLSHPVIVHLKTAARNGDTSAVLAELRKMLRID